MNKKIPSKLSYYFIIAVIAFGILQYGYLAFGIRENLMEHQWLTKVGASFILDPLNAIIMVLMALALFFWIRPNGKIGFLIVVLAILLPTLKDLCIGLLSFTDLEFTKNTYLISREARGLSDIDESRLNQMFSVYGVAFSLLFVIAWAGIQLKIIFNNKAYLLKE